MRRMLLLAGMALGTTTAQAQGHRFMIGSDTATWLGVSGQLRLRGEHWSGFGAGAPAGADLDDAFGLSRLMVRGEFHLAGHVTALAEVKSSLAVSRTLPGGRRPADEDVLDVQQLYAEGSAAVGRGHLSLRAGRFDLALGRERLVSPLDWTNARRAFQGAAARVSGGGLDARIFWVQPVQVRRRQPNIPDSTKQLYGLHLAHSGPQWRVETYWLRTESRSAAFNGTAGYERRHTLGSRFGRRPAARRLDADLEVAWQTGSVGAARVGAMMIASQAGWTFAGARGVRLYAGVDAASGDATAGGNVRTFNQLFPLSHAYLGYADVHGRQNIVAGNLGASARLLRDLPVQLDVWDFRRASTADALYGADGSVSRAAGTGLSAHVGTEVDLTVRRALAHGRLALQAGASRYVAGAFLAQSGPSRDITWVYLQSTASF